MSARRSGIIIRMPSSPPSTRPASTRVDLEIEPEDHDRRHRHADAEGDRLAGEPAVCTMLFSRIVASRRRASKEPEQRDRDDRDGIDALTVSRPSARDRATSAEDDAEQRPD
jgi:hypothetical protein